jgi:hypothetical protein
LGHDTGWFARPVRLSISNRSGLRVDVRQISLRDAQGQELLKNGDFRRGGTYWTYTSDDHLGWHMKNLALATWLSWGLPGALSLGAFLALGISRSAKSCWAVQPMAAAWLAALTGFLAVSAFDTLIETPRFLMLLLLLGWFACKQPGEVKR